jgi:hypothetical protein
MKKILSLLVLTSFVVGCSTASKDIAPTYVSTALYANYDCEQVRADLMRVNGQLQTLTGKLDKNRENDTVTTTVGMVLFWPSLFFLGGTKEQESQYAQLRGEYQALEQVSIQKKCMLGAEKK